MQEFFWTFVKFSLVGVLGLPFLDFIYLLPLSPSGELLENGFERSSVIANYEPLFSSSLASTKSLSSLAIVGSGSNSKLSYQYLYYYLPFLVWHPLFYCFFFLQFHFLLLTNLTEISFSWLFFPLLMLL